MIIKPYETNMFKEVHSLWEKTGIGLGPSDSKNRLKKYIHRNPETFLVGTQDNKIISAVMGGTDGRRGLIHHFSVDPEYQRKGYGKQMIDYLVKIFAKNGVLKVHLFIEKYNQDVIEFYKKFGCFVRDDLIMMTIIPNKNLPER